MRKTVKATFLFLNIFLCIFILSFVRVVFLLFPAKRTFLVSYIAHIFNKISAFILGIKVKVSGKSEFLKTRGIFFVINHLSYLDGVIASSLSPLVFIGRSDLKSWPLFGTLTSLSDTIFVNRIDPSNIHRELERIAFFLSNRTNVILFPEGTSTNGKELLPFKTSFFEAPLKVGCKIVPLAIRYTRINTEELNDKNKDLIYWYGDMEFLPHLFGVLKLKRVDVEVRVFKSLSISEIPNEKVSFLRKYLSSACQEIIEDYLNPEEAK